MTIDIDDLLTYTYPDEENAYENGTRFNPFDAPTSQQDKYRRLMSFQHGHNGKWRDKNLARKDDRKKVYDSVASHLELTDYQKSEGFRIYMKEVNHEMLGVRAEEGVIAVCAIVCAVADNRNYLYDDAFRDLIDRYDFSTNSVKATFRRVREQIKPPYGTDDNQDRTVPEGVALADGGIDPKEEAKKPGVSWDF
jgi:transcription initiation factor TFIIIB Brf1 subunit/transcription initiation factor TFIIB